MTALAPAPIQDRPILGLGLMLGFCITAPLSDGIAKLLTDHFAVMQLTFVRFVVQAAVLVPLVLATGRSFQMSRLGWQLTVLRTILQITGIWLMVTALIHLPLADALAIAFVMPFILLLMGHLILGEHVGPRRLGACAVGFCGTLLVMQPSFQVVGWAVLYPLGVAVVFATFMLVTRRVATEADPIAMQASSGGMAVFALGTASLLLPDTTATTFATPGDLWWLLLLMGLLGTGGHLLMTWSLRYAPTATLGPIQYLEIPVATVIGFLLFGDWPNGLAMAGIVITIATGLYILWCERQIANDSR
ncbi:MAG: DMT family transporter [Pseudomonadota bacterium]